MYWGAGSALGVLTFFGYLLLAMGALLVWRNRDDFSVWFQDEISVLRRSFSRYTPVDPYYILREEYRIKAIPTYFIRNINRLPRSLFICAAALLLAGMMLFLLDFFL